jgi:ubiquinone/menaquinone biosynthesis C-methylase UbiE
VKIFKFIKKRLNSFLIQIKYFFQEKILDFMIRRATGHPESNLDVSLLGSQIQNYSRKFDNYPPYFDCMEFEGKFVRPFVSKSVKCIAELQPNRSSSILDVCGGPGNQGLALLKNGYRDYTNCDIDVIRMKWGALVWAENGQKMNYVRMDATKKFTFSDQTFDIVTLLGWESPTLPYSYTLDECSRVLKNEGLLIFTYHDELEVIEGNWDADPERKYSFLPYSIGEDALNLLLSRNRLVRLNTEYSGYRKELHDFFPDRQEREFPQKFVVCKKVINEKGI